MDNREKCIELFNNWIKHKDLESLFKIVEFAYDLRDPEKKDEAMAFFRFNLIPDAFTCALFRWLPREFNLYELRNSNNQLILVY